MTLQQARNKALQILNSYSIDGKIIPDTYNGQADMKIRLTAFADDAQQELARTNARIVRTQSVPVFAAKTSWSTTPGATLNADGYVCLSAGNGKAFTVEVCGDCLVSASVGGTEVYSEKVYPSDGAFVLVHAVLSNDSQQGVEITVSSDYRFLYRNAAVYVDNFPTADSVPRNCGYYQPTTPSDLIDYVNGEIRFNGEQNTSFVIDNRSIRLDNSQSGLWEINYYAAPTEINSDTPDSYIFEIPTLHEAIPYKMAYLVALSVDGVNVSTLTSIKNEYSQLVSSAIYEPKFYTTPITDYYGGI